MKTQIPGRVSLVFPLEVEDGWPPFGVESMPFDETPSGYRAVVAPLFVKDLSVGDVIEADVGPDGDVRSWKHVARSAHTTIWLLRMESPTMIAPVLDRLQELGCSTVRLEEAGTYAIDVPESVSMDDVDALLEELDSDAVAAAFPSMRHPE